VAWTITSDEPVQEQDDPEHRDRTIYTWHIVKGEEPPRTAYVAVANNLKEDVLTLDDPEVREAFETKGRSAFEKYLEWDDPPEQIQVTNAGISPEPPQR
jgi:hypothetical protein